MAGNDFCGKTKVGIMTFHWADSFGAMLQAYGLLTWLSEENFDAFIVNYAPPFLRGREWFFPYVPIKGLKKRLCASVSKFHRNVLTGGKWWRRRGEMNSFRREYLTKGRKTIYRLKKAEQLEADLLIVGSDQIWNPEITFGFQPAYFGVFANGRARRTVAYAASFGTASLPEEAEAEFSKLLVSVDEISMREKSAAEYVKARFQRNASYVVDPVFLLEVEKWLAIADRPKERGFILYYETEYCEPLRKAANRFAMEKDLKIIELSAGRSRRYWPFQQIYSAGPAQFLGYIHAAEYVFTNSFHGLAFSILFHKPFYIRNHSAVGARIKNLLEYTGLMDRMAGEDHVPNAEEGINWMEVERRLYIHRQQSMEFLRHSLQL